MASEKSAAPKVIFYECDICGQLHPWEWWGDCREDENRGFADEWAARLGITEFEIEIRSMEDRLEADLMGVDV